MALSAQQLKFFADFIEAELGIVYSASNAYQLEKRLDDICKALEVPDKEALWKKASDEGIQGHFRQLLLDTATNNETSFFRDPKVFHMIAEHIIPEWRKKNPDAKLFRIWSAASSFGQEPYSLVMMLEKLRETNHDMPRVEVLASDISEEALKKAKLGIYSQLEVQRGLEAMLLVKYFSKKDDDYWHIKPAIRGQVQFKKVNLLDITSIPSGFDLVLCRNVLIYQNEERKKTIISNITKKITDQGAFILGSAESLIGLSDQFQQEIYKGAVFYRKK